MKNLFQWIKKTMRMMKRMQKIPNVAPTAMPVTTAKMLTEITTERQGKRPVSNVFFLLMGAFHSKNLCCEYYNVPGFCGSVIVL